MALTGPLSVKQDPMNNLKAKLFGARGDEPVSAGPWRVNFVNASTLPDIKVVRTAFVLNYGLAILATAMVGYGVHQELSIADVSAQVAELESQAVALTPADTKIRQSSALFLQYAAAVDEYARFKTSGLDVFALYAQLGELRVNDIVYDNVLIDTNSTDSKKKVGAKITLSGKCKGVTKEGFTRIEALYAKFVGMPYLRSLTGYEPKYAKSPVTVPDNQAQVIQFTFQLTLEPKS